MKPSMCWMTCASALLNRVSTWKRTSRCARLRQDKFIEEEAKPVAIKRLERSLILDKLANEEKIEVDENSLAK